MSGTRIYRIAAVIAVLAIAPSMVRAAFFHKVIHPDISAAQPILADVNGDGRADLIGLGPTVWFANADGTFQTGVSYGAGGQRPLSIAVADVNGDGRSDIVQLNACDSGGNCSNGVIGVLLGNADGSFQTAMVFNAGPSPKAVAIADADGDGEADLVFIAGSNAGTLLGNGDGTFQALKTSNLGMQPLSMVTADVNRDGRVDLVMIDSAMAWVSLANADGTFQAAQSHNDGIDSLVQVVAGDVNRDGNPDIVALNQCVRQDGCGGGEFSVLLGNGDGTFQAPIVESTGSVYPNAIAIMDVNRDGVPDLVILQCVRGVRACLTGGGGKQGPAKLTMFAGDGSGHFQFLAHLGAGARSSSAWLAVGDVTGDGHPDVVEQSGSFGVFVHTGGRPK